MAAPASSVLPASGSVRGLRLPGLGGGPVRDHLGNLVDDGSAQLPGREPVGEAGRNECSRADADVDTELVHDKPFDPVCGGRARLDTGT